MQMYEILTDWKANFRIRMSNRVVTFLREPYFHDFLTKIEKL